MSLSATVSFAAPARFRTQTFRLIRHRTLATTSELNVARLQPELICLRNAYGQLLWPAPGILRPSEADLPSVKLKALKKLFLQSALGATKRGDVHNLDVTSSTKTVDNSVDKFGRMTV
jgi:hypothetical protein